MSELFIELFSEEVPAKLQIKAREQLKEILKKNLDYKVDVIIDSIGGQDTLDSLSFLSWEGSLVPMGFASNKIANIPANLILLKNISIVGVFWGPFAKGNKGFTLDSIHKINEFLFHQAVVCKPFHLVCYFSNIQLFGSHLF